MSAAVNSCSDLVIFDYIREYGNKSLPRYLFNENKIFTKEDRSLFTIILGPLGDAFYYPDRLDALNPVCFKLYKKDLLQNVLFVGVKESGSAEDILFNTSVFSQEFPACYIRYAGYHYRRNESTSITKSYRQQLPEKRLFVYDHLMRYANNEELKQAVNNRFAYYVLSLGLNEMENPEGFRKQIAKIKHMLSFNPYKDALSNLALVKIKPLHWRLFFGFAKYGCSFMVYAKVYAEINQ